MKPCDASPDCLHPACKYCDRPVRTSGTSIGDHPNTIIGLVRNRVCSTCKRTDGAPRRLLKAPEHCVSCDHPMRQQSVPKESAPGTRIYQGRGLCTRCYMRARRAATASDRAKQREAEAEAREWQRKQKAQELARKEREAAARKEHEWLQRLQAYEPGTYRYIMSRRERKARSRILATRKARSRV